MGTGGEKDKTASAASAPGGKRPARKKRRYLRVLLIVLVVLVIIVGVTPLLVSTRLGTRAIVGLINSRIKGTVHVDDLSVSWLRPCRIQNVRVMDPDGREVLRIADVKYARGILGALRNAMDFGQVSVVSPRVTLYLDSRGSSSLAAALKPSRPRQPKTSQPDKPLPAVKGSVKVTDALSRVTSLVLDASANVTAVVKKLKIPQPTVSHHLSILREASLVTANRQGKQVIYSLNDAQVQSEKMLKATCEKGAGIKFGPLVFGAVKR